MRWIWDGDDVVQPFRKPADVPANYVPFNIQYLNGLLYVAYAELIQPADPDYSPENRSPSAPALAAVMSPCSISAAYTFRHLPGRDA